MPETGLETMLAAVPDPMVFITGDGLVASCNPMAAELLGDWIIGRSYAAVLRQPGLLGRIEEVQTHGTAGEARLQLTDQTGETQFRVRITPFTPEGAGHMHPVLLHFTDITHLREAEEMRRNFVANVSHELRTPLTALMGFIETLRGPARNDAEAQTRFLGIMDEEARRMNRLVSDLLSLSRVEEQERQRPADTVDLRAILDGAVAAMRPAAKEKGLDLRVEALPQPGDLRAPEAASATGYHVRGDADQVMQVFLNLAENAVKYGGTDRPVEFRLSWEKGTGSLKGMVARVDVIDRGEGIEPQHLPRLTERFYRIDTHRSREMGGTGLGLAIVKHIVNRHRGRLRITSVRGEGSTFTVLFPRD